MSDGEGSVTPDHDHPIQFHSPGRVEDLLGIVLEFCLPVLIFNRIAERVPFVGGTQNGTAQGKNASNRVQGQGHHFVGFQETVETVLASPDSPIVAKDRRFDDRPDNGVQSGAIASTVEHTDSLLRFPGHLDQARFYNFDDSKVQVAGCQCLWSVVYCQLSVVSCQLSVVSRSAGCGLLL